MLRYDVTLCTWKYAHDPELPQNDAKPERRGVRDNRYFWSMFNEYRSSMSDPIVTGQLAAVSKTLLYDHLDPDLGLCDG